MWASSSSVLVLEPEPNSMSTVSGAASAAMSAACARKIAVSVRVG